MVTYLGGSILITIFALGGSIVSYNLQSGSSVKGKSRISKIGSGNLRKILYFPAIVSSSVNRNFQEFKQRMRAKGKHNMVIIVALMRKLLHIIFAILKNKSIFSYELA